MTQRAATYNAGPQPLEEEEEEDMTPEHLFARFWKSLFAPFKNLKRRLRGFETQLTSVHRSVQESRVGRRMTLVT